PRHVPTAAATAKGAGQMEMRPARSAGADREPLLLGGGKKGPAVMVVFDRQDRRHRHPFVRIRAELAIGGADVTRHTSAFGTWLVDSPRICRTPSTMWFMPWM